VTAQKRAAPQLYVMCQKHEGSSMLNKEQAAAAAEALLAVGTSERVEKNEARLRGISRAFRSQYLLTAQIFYFVASTK